MVIPVYPDNQTKVPYVLITYVVKKDETIGSLLDRFNIKYEDLLRYNNISNIYLLDGKTIKVPNNNPMDDQKYEQ